MANQIDLSKLLELNEAQALAVNGGGDYGDTPEEVTNGRTEDPDGKCDEKSINNYQIKTGHGAGTISVCIAKDTKNAVKYVWDIAYATHPK
jgi:hypothetical protein